MTRKKLLILLGSVCLALVLAVPFVMACAGPAPSPSPTPAPSPSPTPAPSPSPTPVPSPTEKVYEWRLQHFKAPGDCEYDGLERFCNRVRVMSEGRLDITYYPAGTLMPTMEMLDNVAERVIEFGMGAPPYWLGKDPAMKACHGLPFGPGTLELDSCLWWDKGLIDVAREIYAQQGVYLLGLQPICSYGDIMSKVPINNMQDLKGLKIRSGGLTADVAAAAGAAVTMVPAEEFYLALSTGVIDGGMWGGPGAFWDIKIHEIAKYINQPGWAYPVHNDAFINMDIWNSLPDDLKEILDTANQLRGLEIVRCFKADDIIALQKMQADWDVKVSWWDDDALAEGRALALPLWEELASENPLAAEAVGIYKDFMKELGALQ